MALDELRAYLLESRIAGDTKTPRADVIRKAVMLSEGDEDTLLGFDLIDLSVEEVMDALAGLCGCSTDLRMRDGGGYIDPDRTLSMLEAAAARLGDAARRGERVLIATGHPTGLLPMYMAVGRALDGCGAKVLTPRDDEKLGTDPRGKRRNRIRYLEGVGVLHDGASLHHTHEAWPMERLLEGLDAPDLVLADHGWAGAAITRGIETVSFSDVNDPALAVAWARGKTEIVVPLDDNVPPALYGPLTAFLEEAIRG